MIVVDGGSWWEMSGGWDGFTEFEGDHAYCRQNKCETESKELVHYTNTLAYLLTLTA